MFSETHLYQFDPPRDKGKYRDTKLTPSGFLGTKKDNKINHDQFALQCLD